MKIKLNTDSTGCPTNRNEFVKLNSAWIASSNSWKSSSTRARVITSYVRNHEGLDGSLKNLLIDDMYLGAKLTTEGFTL